VPTAYVTVPTEAADELARTLIEEQQAACVNRVNCRSTYRWEGEVHDDAEVVLFVKTTADGYGRLRDRIVELHPHDVPCIERFDEVDVLPAYGQWVADAVDG
jgi:periplasmic divalent cation tolerance protein